MSCGSARGIKYVDTCLAYSTQLQWSSPLFKSQGQESEQGVHADGILGNPITALLAKDHTYSSRMKMR